VIVAENLTKQFGTKVAVDHLTFTVPDGKVTGFLGPNGAGKSTTMRLMLGLDRPSEGSATFNGTPYAQLKRPLTEVGALLDAKYVHPTRTARNHLWALAASNRLPKSRVAEVLDLVGLSDVADQRVGGFSLGMNQRLGLAAAMLGDPHTFLLDEPSNGLDPEGILWIRQFMQYLASQGRSVLVSSHLLGEMEQMVDQLVVIGRGRLIFEGTTEQFLSGAANHWVIVRSPQLARLAEVLPPLGATISKEPDGAMRVVGLDIVAIGEAAAANAVVLHELSPHRESLEDAFLGLTKDVQEYHTEVPT